MFPGSQIGTREPWTKVHKLSTTEWLQYEGTKFSKSKGVGVFGNSAKDTGISADVGNPLSNTHSLLAMNLC